MPQGKNLRRRLSLKVELGERVLRTGDEPAARGRRVVGRWASALAPGGRLGSVLRIWLGTPLGVREGCDSELFLWAIGALIKGWVIDGLRVAARVRGEPGFLNSPFFI